MGRPKKNSNQLLQEQTGRELVGGELSDLATYSDLFNRLQSWVLLLDLTSLRILQANPATQMIFGAKVDVFEGSFFTDWVAESQRDEVLNYLHGVAQGGDAKLKDIQCMGPKKDLHILEVNPCILKLADYTQVLQIIAHDVTETRTAQKRLAELSITDEMTGLANYRHFKERLATEHSRAQRYETQYAIIFCDVDHFKKYNDTHGHPAGDRVLMKVAQTLKSNCRETDLPARYGGEEFVVLSPAVDLLEAKMHAERLRSAIESTHFESEETQPLGKVTISVGLAVFPEHGSTSAEVLKTADEAVYQSKQAGRNQVTVAAVQKQKPKQQKSA